MPSKTNQNPQPANPLTELWLNRRLFWQLTKRNMELRHKGSFLGILWSILGPLLMLSLYVLVFGFIFGGKLNEGADVETRFDRA